MMTKYVIFIYLNALASTVFCHVVFGATIQSLPVLFLLLICSGALFSAMLDSGMVWEFVLALGLNIMVGGAFMVGPVYNEVQLDAGTSRAKKIFMGLILIPPVAYLIFIGVIQAFEN